MVRRSHVNVIAPVIVAALGNGNDTVDVTAAVSDDTTAIAKNSAS